MPEGHIQIPHLLDADEDWNTAFLQNIYFRGARRIRRIMNDQTFCAPGSLRIRKTEFRVTRHEGEPTLEALSFACLDKCHHTLTAPHGARAATIQNDISSVLKNINFLPPSDSGEVHIVGVLHLFFSFFNFLNDKRPPVARPLLTGVFASTVGVPYNSCICIIIFSCVCWPILI